MNLSEIFKNVLLVLYVFLTANVFYVLFYIVVWYFSDMDKSSS